MTAACTSSTTLGRRQASFDTPVAATCKASIQVASRQVCAHGEQRDSQCSEMCTPAAAISGTEMAKGTQMLTEVAVCLWQHCLARCATRICCHQGSEDQRLLQAGHETAECIKPDMSLRDLLCARANTSIICHWLDDDTAENGSGDVFNMTFWSLAAGLTFFVVADAALLSPHGLPPGSAAAALLAASCGSWPCMLHTQSCFASNANCKQIKHF